MKPSTKQNVTRGMLIAGLLLVAAACSNPVIFQAEWIEYGLTLTMKRTAGSNYSVSASGERCFIYYNGSEEGRGKHQFKLNDVVANSSVVTDPPNRIVVRIVDDYGLRPGQSFGYVLSLEQNGLIVENLPFRMENNSTNTILYRHTFTIKNDPDPAKPNDEGSFRKKDRTVGGTYYLSSTDGMGRDARVEIYFPIANNQKVFDYCDVLQ